MVTGPPQRLDHTILLHVVPCVLLISDVMTVYHLHIIRIILLHPLHQRVLDMVTHRIYVPDQINLNRTRAGVMDIFRIILLQPLHQRVLDMATHRINLPDQINLNRTRDGVMDIVRIILLHPLHQRVLDMVTHRINLPDQIKLKADRGNELHLVPHGGQID